MFNLDAARERGRQRAEDYIYGCKVAAGGWPREWCAGEDALRGYDRVAARLEAQKARVAA